MNIRLIKGLLIALLILAGLTLPVSAEDLRFSGDKGTNTGVFEMDSPWALDWSARGKEEMSCSFTMWQKDAAAGLPCNFEMRLIDADSGEHLGMIAQLAGEGRGYKLFEKPGRYQIEVIAQNVSWEFMISAVDEQMAAKLKTGPTLGDKALRAATRVPEGSFESWRPVDDETLLLFAAGNTKGFRVTFTEACPGLSEATALSFITAMKTRADAYDSILLDDGTRCYFERVVPTVFE